MFENESRRKRILFVEDEPGAQEDLRKSLFRLTQEWDMVPVTGTDDALKALALEPFDVLLADTRAHRADGAEFLTQAMSSYPETVRLVLSDPGDAEESVRLVRAVHQCLTKPCRAETLKATLDRIFALRRILAGKSLRRLVSGLTNLPSLPAAYQALLETLNSPSAGANEIGELVIHDMAMTAKILQLTNSAFFGIQHRVTNLTEAIQYLGVETLRALALISGVFSQFKVSRVTSLSLERLQQHSLDTGCVARMIATRESLSKQVADDAFLAGLLHDVGKLILITKDAEMYDRTMAIVRKDKLRLDHVEREVFGADHAEVGSYLLWLWALPEAVSEAVAFHHRPAECPAQGMTALALVHIADQLLHESSPDRSGWPQLDPDYLASAGLADRIPEWRGIAEDILMERSA